MKDKKKYYKNLVDICRYYDMTYGFTDYKPFNSDPIDPLTRQVLFKVWSCEYHNYESDTPLSQKEVLDKVLGKLDPVPRIGWVFLQLDEWSQDHFIQPFTITNQEERFKLWCCICLEYIKIRLEEIKNKTVKDPHYQKMGDYKRIPENFGFTDETMERIFKWLDSNLYK